MRVRSARAHAGRRPAVAGEFWTVAKPLPATFSGRQPGRVCVKAILSRSPVRGLRSAQWQFVAHVRNTNTGDEWIDVVGGRPGDRKLRSFSPDRVFAPAAGQGRRNARASLADEPMLPFN